IVIIEYLVMAAAWMVRPTKDYAHSMLILGDAKNVTYKSFVSPGQVLELAVDIKEITTTHSRFTGVGRCGSTEMVKAHWSLRHFNLAEEDPRMGPVDEKLIAQARQQMTLLRR